MHIIFIAFSFRIPEWINDSILTQFFLTSKGCARKSVRVSQHGVFMGAVFAFYGGTRQQKCRLSTRALLLCYRRLLGALADRMPSERLDADLVGEATEIITEETARIRQLVESHSERSG